MCATGECSGCQMLAEMESEPMGVLPPAPPLPACDKDHLAGSPPATGIARCDTCGKVYARCDAHGGGAAVRRSLKSHRGLYHPKTPAT